MKNFPKLTLNLRSDRLEKLLNTNRKHLLVEMSLLQASVAATEKIQRSNNARRRTEISGGNNLIKCKC